jgi:hypothetical protein
MTQQQMFPAGEPFRALIGHGPDRSAIVHILPLTERRSHQHRVRSALISQLDESLHALEMLKVC